VLKFRHIAKPETVGKHAKQTTMTNSEWLDNLYDQQILTHGELEGYTRLIFKKQNYIRL